MSDAVPAIVLAFSMFLGIILGSTITMQQQNISAKTINLCKTKCENNQGIQYIYNKGECRCVDGARFVVEIE